MKDERPDMTVPNIDKKYDSQGFFRFYGNADMRQDDPARPPEQKMNRENSFFSRMTKKAFKNRR